MVLDPLAVGSESSAKDSRAAAHLELTSGWALRIAIRLDRCGSSVVIHWKSGNGSSYFFSCSSSESEEAVETNEGEYFGSDASRFVVVDLDFDWVDRDLRVGRGMGRGSVSAMVDEVDDDTAERMKVRSLVSRE